jgi:hypothetical protein
VVYAADRKCGGCYQILPILTITVSIRRVGVYSAVVLRIRHAVVVIVIIAGVSHPITVGILLEGVGVNGTVVVPAGLLGRVVARPYADTVSVPVVRRVIGTDIADIPHIIIVGVLLPCVGCQRTVVAGVPHAIRIAILLARVRYQGTVFAGVSHSVAITIGLVWVRDEQAVVRAIEVVIPVGILARIADSVAVRIFLQGIVEEDAVVYLGWHAIVILRSGAQERGGDESH